MKPAAQDGLSAAQVEDLAAVVASLGRDIIIWLVKSILGEGPVADAADDVGDAGLFASKMVAALRDAGRLSEAVAILRKDAVPRGRLAVDLEYILRGGRLSDANARQAFTNEVEPFFNSAEFQQRHPRFLRTICAIALGQPWNEIRGSGFLIGPDLVMTNAHVLDPFLERNGGEVTEAGGVSGDQILCFFDYHSDPAPKVPLQDGKHAFVTVTAQKEKWLYHARDLLPGEGTAQCPKDALNRYDYAVIVLSRNPKPIIGRDEFRENVLDVHRDPGSTPRVMAVLGPPGSGLRYSVELLRRTLGLDVRIATFSADVLSSSSPRKFLSSLASSLSFYAFQESEIPAEDAAADLPRWLDGDLPRWLATRLEAEAKRDPSRYPAWVVLNIAVDDFKWPYLMPELLAALAGAHDQGKAAVTMPNLRFLFLASKSESLPSMPGVPRVNEDLTTYTIYAQDFVDCLDRALYAIDRHSDIGDPRNWMLVADDWVLGFEPAERRKVLSGKVRNFVLHRLKEKQG